ncbi:MAG: hypothetical protein AAGC64_09380 [Bacteroidota bacterium]
MDFQNPKSSHFHFPNRYFVATSAFDIYDFDSQPWSSQTFIRNVATMGANAIRIIHHKQ